MNVFINEEGEEDAGFDADREGEDAAILIVDDELMNLEVHEAMISSMKNLKSDTALSGAIALELVRERLDKVLQGRAAMYKFILMVYSMPNMDGPQTVEKIREMLRNGIRELQDD